MSQSGVAVIGADLVVLGDVKGARLVEVYGLVRGRIEAEMLRVHPGGMVMGPVKVGSAEVNGALEGDSTTTGLMAIGVTGRVTGRIRYGRLSLSEGGELNADVRNIPPQLTGDFQISVRKGRSVRISTEDIAAVDPDDTAKSLTFTVSAPVNGFVSFLAAPGTPIARFTQAELEAGQVLFVHRGSDTSPASFDVIVTDKAGAQSAARTVKAAVVA